MERTFGSICDTDTERASSRNPSLIGSRFFAKSRRYGSKSSEASSTGFNEACAEAPSETVIKFAFSEVFVRLRLPREDEKSSPMRPFDIFASDVDLLIELMPEGKDETVITLGVMDLSVDDTSRVGVPMSLVSLTAHRSFSTNPKSMVKLRFTSLVVPETTAKESRLKLTLWGFTYDAYPDLKWVADLGRFVKAPPGAFESVIPSERTRVSVKITDGSIRGLAPTHPGAAVLYIGELGFTTDIVGDSPEFSFHLSVPSISVLFIDSLPSPHDGAGTKQAQAASVSGGISHWKGAGYALMVETVDLDLTFQSSNITNSPDTRVVINRVGLRMHLCADTLHAFTAFAGEVNSVFKPPVDNSVPKPKERPTTISEQARTKRGILSSVDEHAFRRVPEVGPAPDMIYDDLPSNLDYLDASFGTAAGLRELRDDDLDEFDPEDAESGRVTPTQGSQQLGITSNGGGETIKMLRPLNIVEHHFETLPPDSAGGNSEYVYFLSQHYISIIM
jgi:autophagy-related protein 2